MTSLKIPALAFALFAAAAVAAAPASAGPINGVGLKSAVTDDVVVVKSKRKQPRADNWNGYWAPRFGGVDTVGSLGYDGRGYAYNRFSGQVYMTCMEDLGYGRVRPCDAGRR